MTRFDAVLSNVGGRDVAGKECALIARCEEDDTTVLDGARVSVERICSLSKWHMVGEVLVPGVRNCPYG